jgi:hypothetical protein
LLAGVAIASKDGGAAPGSVVRGVGTAVIMAVTGYLATVVSATAFGGADISWLVGFVVAGGLYYLVTPRQPGGTPVASGTPRGGRGRRSS